MAFNRTPQDVQDKIYRLSNKGMTRLEICEECKVTPNTVIRYESQASKAKRGKGYRV